MCSIIVVSSSDGGRVVAVVVDDVQSTSDGASMLAELYKIANIEIVTTLAMT